LSSYNRGEGAALEIADVATESGRERPEPPDRPNETPDEKDMSIITKTEIAKIAIPFLVKVNQVKYTKIIL
jgi:hypothetical protein